MLNNLQKDVVLAPYTTYQIGGPADYFIVAHNKQELIKALEWSKKENQPTTIIGGGSNLLISDLGVSGLVILNKANQFTFTNQKVIAESGSILAVIARKTIEQGLSGLDFAANIPGTLGGAIIGNAGAYGREISSAFSGALVWDYKKGLIEYNSRNFDFTYRSSVLKNNYKKFLISAEVKLQIGDKEQMLRNNQLDFNKRKEHYRGLSCGSYFRNPQNCQIKINNKILENPPAGLLIDTLGLKNLVIGGACVSKYHANVILNTDKAKAQDIINLEKIIVKRVINEYGIALKTEVIKIGIFD